MIGKFFSRNGSLLPTEEATVSIDNLAFTYGYGVYENLKVRNGVLYFPQQHAERLLNSASILGLDHEFSRDELVSHFFELARSVGEDSFNIKVLLLGGKETTLYIFALAPKFPDKKLYTHGAQVITHPGSRLYPNAKTLNMLQSFLAYKKATEARAYDALLVDADGCIPEGTRTNLFFFADDVLYTPPKEDVLEGVTRTTVIEALKQKGIPVNEKKLHKDELSDLQGLFLTSTSSKIIPVSQVDDLEYEVPALVKDTMNIFDEYSNSLLKQNPDWKL